MPHWRISAESRNDEVQDITIDAAEDAIVEDLGTALQPLSICLDRLYVDDCPVQGLPRRARLDQSPLRNGSMLAYAPSLGAPGPGSYLVAVAGPEAGVWKPITEEWTSVGRSAGNTLVLNDPVLSRTHLRIRAAADQIVLEDCGSTNGVLIDGVLVRDSAPVPDGAYIEAGSTTLAVVVVEPSPDPPADGGSGPSVPFQRRFRAALVPLQFSLQHPKPPTSGSTERRSIVSTLAPVVTSAGMGLMIALGLQGGRALDIFGVSINRVWLYLPLVALGPVIFALEGLRRRRREARKKLAEQAEYEAKQERFLADLAAARVEELRRDRWAATPAGVAALLAAARHPRLWERSPSDDDFCEFAVGLHERPSQIDVAGRPDGASFDMDVQWSAVLRHSLVREGSLAVLGDIARGRSLARALLLDLATSHSPGDLSLWLITDDSAAGEWNDLRWLPHTFMGDAQNTVFSTPASRAAAFSSLRSLITERAATRESRRGNGPMLPIYVVVVDCLAAVDPAELADVLVDGVRVGVFGIVIDEQVTPEGVAAQLTLGEFADESWFVSETQPRAERVRSIEMSVQSFAASARSLASLRPARSNTATAARSEMIRLVDLIGAETDPGRYNAIVQRWRGGDSSRIRVGGLGDLVTEIDLMRDGPHGLVGGTTRSGKTEFLKSLFTSLAVAKHPDDLSIVIVDFKGGVDHGLSARLPHVIDLSTNHDVDSFVRSIHLINAELERRQREFRKVGAPNLDAYRVARRSTPSLIPIPRLLIVIDEFSELLSSETGRANLNSLESVTRVGGGLGVHLLLVTQNFENQLPSQIAANAGLRICFRVQEATHSKAVLNSPEAASIPKEQIGRAFLRSHGGPATEFQGARIGGPLPGREARTEPVKVRHVPFSALADKPPEAPITDVPAEDTDMHAVVEVIRRAAHATGWKEPAVPWPAELPLDLSVADLGDSELPWPVGLADEPYRQRQRPVGLDLYGPSTLFLGGPDARLGEVVRAALVAGAMRRSPEELHFYVIDLLGQGLTALGGFPHIGAVAERNEPLAIRILRHIGEEVTMRKAALSDIGASSVAELNPVAAETMPDTVLAVNGADRLLMHGEPQPSPLLAPLTNLVAESAGTGVRLLLAGTPPLAHQRLGAQVGRRFVLSCSDPNDYSSLGVPRALQDALNGPGRAVELTSGRLMQFALLPSSPRSSPGDVAKALGARLTDRWQYLDNSAMTPRKLRELAWPLPLDAVRVADPPEGIAQPVALCLNTETGEIAWLDAEEDGPSFVICGPPGSGRSNALIASATLMARRGWRVLGVPFSRRSPLASGAFPGSVVGFGDLAAASEWSMPVAVYLDDVHKWRGDADGLRAMLDGPGARAVIVTGPADFFGGHNDLTRIIRSRSALVLTPKTGYDASGFGVRRLSEDTLRDVRAGRGVLVVAGETSGAQVPLAV